MREIKFRAWQPHSSLHRKPGMYQVSGIEWYGKLIDDKTGEVFFLGHVSSEYLEDIKLMQYTGLKDKNGKEIYEGDIVKEGPKLRDYGKSRVYEVVYGNLYWAGYEDSGSGVGFNLPLGFKELGSDKLHELGDKLDDIEVIGNIYENPELVK